MCGATAQKLHNRIVSCGVVTNTGVVGGVGRRRECLNSRSWSRRVLRALAHPRGLAGCGHGRIVTKADFVAGTGGAHLSLDATA